MGAGGGAEAWAGRLAGWVIASYRQVDGRQGRLPEDTEAGATAPGELAASVSAQGSALPPPSH